MKRDYTTIATNGDLILIKRESTGRYETWRKVDPMGKHCEFIFESDSLDYAKKVLEVYL